MKKILSTLTVFAVMITMVFALSTEVVAASGNLSGPSTVEKGTTFTVSYVISATECQGINATVSYNSSELTLNSVTDKNGANIEYENGVLFLDMMSSPITGSSTILNFSFTAVGAKGTKVNFRLKGISVTENYDEVSMPEASYMVTISDSTTYPLTPNPSSSQGQSTVQQPVESKPASTTQTSTSTSTDTLNKPATSSESSTSSGAVSSESSNPSEITSSTEGTVPETQSSDKQDTNKKSGKNIWIIVGVCGLTLCGVIGVLLFVRAKKY